MGLKPDKPGEGWLAAQGTRIASVKEADRDMAAGLEEHILATRRPINKRGR
jgi:hypothetical protein